MSRYIIVIIMSVIMTTKAVSFEATIIVNVPRFTLDSLNAPPQRQSLHNPLSV